MIHQAVVGSELNEYLSLELRFTDGLRIAKKSMTMTNEFNTWTVQRYKYREKWNGDSKPKIHISSLNTCTLLFYSTVTSFIV